MDYDTWKITHAIKLVLFLIAALVCFPAVIGWVFVLLGWTATIWIPAGVTVVLVAAALWWLVSHMVVA